VFAYDLPAASRVQLSVFDLLGRRVTVLVEGTQTAGSHVSFFDGSALPSGTYLVRLQAGENVRTQKAVLLK
jgi:hypothetical protein